MSAEAPSPSEAAAPGATGAVEGLELQGAAFTPLVKGAASALMAGLIVYGIRVAEDLVQQRASWPLLLFMGLLMTTTGFCCWWMLISRTTITRTHLRQSWWTPKDVAFADITQTKLILIPGLTWLVAPRLVVRTRSAGSTTFYAAQPQLMAAFARVSLGLPPVPDDPGQGDRPPDAE